MQRARSRDLHPLATLMMVAAVGGCGGDDSGPSQSPPVIAKATTKSGDAQVGPVGQALPNVLRVVVTRDGNAVPNITVSWSTGSGSLDPGSAPTDAEGLSSSTWTLGDTPGTQAATASVSGATGSPVTFTATATGSGQGATTIQVLGPAGGNRFSPANVTVLLGTPVTWEWPDGSVGHNVVPDDGTTPPTSGLLASGPHTYTYTFNVPGTYHFHCQAHGASGGIGMSGTVTVVAGL